MEFSKKVYILKNLAATNKFAQALGVFLQKQETPFYLLLTGDLGAGKTTLTKALLKSLNVKEPVTSPTFVILNQYETDELVINHMDAYRLSTNEDLAMYEEYFTNSLNIIEWPENIDLNWDNLPHLKLEIKIISENERQVTLK